VTPNMTLSCFGVLFRGRPLHEQPHSYVRNILCIDQVVQPYALSSPRESGMIFFASRTILFKDNYPSFHIFLNISPQMTYQTKRKFCYGALFRALHKSTLLRAAHSTLLRAAHSALLRALLHYNCI
jgi:hypothetical protein